MSNGQLSNKPHRSTAKTIATALGIFALITIVVMLCLPLFFSSSWGKKMFISMLGERLGMELKVDQLSVSWFGPQTLTGIQGNKAQDQLTFSCQEITTDASLIKLIAQNNVGKLKVIAPELQISKSLQSTSTLKSKKPISFPNMQSASLSLASLSKTKAASRSLSLQGYITIEQGKIRFNPPGVDPIRFEQLASSIDLRRENEMAFALTCQTSQQQTRGQISIKGTLKQLQNPIPDLSIQSTITNLPMRGIDQLASLFSPELNGLVLNAVGETINVQCNMHSSSGNVHVNLNAQSPLLSAQIVTESNHGILDLKAPAALNFTATPLFIQKLAKLLPSLSRLSLSTPALFQVNLSQFSCPLPLNKDDLFKSSFQASITAPVQLPVILDGNPITLNNLSFKTNTPAMDQGIEIHASSTLQNKDQTGSFILDGKVILLENQAFSGNISINAYRLPADFLGTFIPTSIPFSFLVGPSIDLSCVLDLATAQPKLHFSWKSAYLNLPSLDVSLSDPWILVTPAPFSYAINPQLMTALFPEGNIALANDSLIQGEIKNFSFSPNNPKNINFEVNMNTKDIAFSEGMPLTISQLRAVLDVKTLDQISLQIDGSPFKASLLGKLNMETNELSLTKPLTAQYTLDNVSLQRLSPQAPKLIQPAVFAFSVDPFKLNLSGNWIDTLKLKGQLAVAQLAFTMPEQNKPISLQNLQIPIQWDSNAQTAALQLSGQVQNPSGSPGSLKGQFSLSNFMSDKTVNLVSTTVIGSLDLNNISSLFLDAFSGKPHLSALTGPFFSSQIKLQSTMDKQNFSLKWTSPYLKVDSAFVLDSSSLQLHGSNNQITWTLTPEGYKTLDSLLTAGSTKTIPFEMKEPSTFSFTLTKMHIPIINAKTSSIETFSDRFQNIPVHLSTLQISASGNNPKLTFYDKSSQELIQLSSLVLSVNKNTEQSPIKLSLDTSIVSQSLNSESNQSAKSGSVSLESTIETTLTPKKEFDLSELTGNFQLKVHQLPSRILDLFARAKGRTDFPFTTVFGNLINANASLNLKNFNGPVSINLNTLLTRASLSGTIINGAMMLSEPIYAQMKITPEISRLVLKEVNPLSLSYIYSEDPVTLEIPADGFYFPFYPLNLEKAVIPEAKIELGKISCRNEGNVNITLGLLKTKQFDKNGNLSLWFAPIELDMQKGFVNIDRTEILLADTFDICTWGKIDLLKDYVDMVLGLTAQALKKAFGIKNLPEEYVLTIPMKGPADNVQINTGKATAKVALLLAWQQKSIAGAIGGGPAGAIVGELLGKLATLPDANAKVPPAKHPFPWEVGQKKKKTSSNSHEKKRHFKQNEKPLKQIFKVIK